MGRDGIYLLLLKTSLHRGQKTLKGRSKREMEREGEGVSIA